MSWYSIRRVAFLASTMLIIPVGGDAASANEDMKYKIVAHSTGFVLMDAGDKVEGHILGSAKFVGIMYLDDGRVASTAYLAQFDYIKGSGKFSTFQTYTFDDGSIIRSRNSGATVLENGKSSFPDIKIEILGGEGKYKGITGSGESKGARINAIADGGDSFFDGVLHIQRP